MITNEPKLDHDKYPQVFNREYPIKDMSIGYIKTQLEKIDRTEINSEYLDDLRKEYKFKTGNDFVLEKDKKPAPKSVKKLKPISKPNELKKMTFINTQTPTTNGKQI